MRDGEQEETSAVMPETSGDGDHGRGRGRGWCGGSVGEDSAPATSPPSLHQPGLSWPRHHSHHQHRGELQLCGPFVKLEIH